VKFRIEDEYDVTDPRDLLYLLIKRSPITQAGLADVITETWNESGINATLSDSNLSQQMSDRSSPLYKWGIAWLTIERECRRHGLLQWLAERAGMNLVPKDTSQKPITNIAR